VLAAFGDDKRAEVDETLEMLTGNLEKIAASPVDTRLRRRRGNCPP
jgi:hypothetical protein